jgi:cyclic beta-1,2-glucan synthetase
MVLNKEQLSEEAHKSALNHDPFICKKSSNYFWRSFESDLENLRTFVNEIREKCSSCSQPSEEWLLDNSEFLEEQAVDIKNESSKKLINTLPHLSNTNHSRTFTICEDYLNHSDGHLNMESFITYVRSYQEISVLKIAEVWAMPLLMRVALIGHLSKIMRTIKERHETCQLVQKLLLKFDKEKITSEGLKQVLEDAGKEMPLSGPMIVHLIKHLRERADYTAAVGEWLICKLENGPESLDQILSYEYQVQADYQVTTGNIISSLRKISRWDWQEVFSQISMVEKTLCSDNTGSYSKLDFSSRNIIRDRVEQLARRLNLPENLIASKSVELTETYVKEHSLTKGESYGRKASIAYYLLEPDGIKLLRETLKMCGKPRALPETIFRNRATGTYFNTIAIFFLLTLVTFSVWIGRGERITPMEWVVIFCALWMPAMEWSITLTHWIIERVKKPIHLLRYDFSKEIPMDASTMVVIPVIWSTIEEVKEMTDRLEMHYLANRDPNIHFALLGDFADADTEIQEHDEAIIVTAKKDIDHLNKTYPETTFHLFQRKRQWNPCEDVWMGWERKRGKLVEFVELLKGRKDTSFSIIMGDRALFDQIRYVITLDADTILPLESAKRMIGTLHLPYNRPRLNDRKTRVVTGYGVLQPRIGMSHEATMRSRLATLLSGDPGFDPYAFAISDPYQDGFGQGIFTGKGIFDVDTFYELLCERIPENRVLSHDLLEGGFLRAGLLSDIELIDDQPAKFIALQKRQHRWVRGDWQLLLWLLPRVQNRNGKLLAVDLSILTRWQIFDNLRRSLLSPILFIILLLAFAVLPGSPYRWIEIIFATWFLPVLRQLIISQTLIRDRRNILYTIGQTLVSIVTLPFQIVVLVDGIVRSLYRLCYSKRHLLEWATSAEVNRSLMKKGIPPLYGMYRGYILITLFLILSFVTDHAGLQIIGLTLCAVWDFAPFMIRWLDQPSKQKVALLTNEEKEELKNLSKQIWDFYEDYVSEQENWLPPDNVQMQPNNGVAHRTSPTNIGLYLTCVLAAKDFEFIDKNGLLERLDRTLNTIEKMEKWEGHLYNWYDTETLKPLNPMYVSTVDSGNFVGCLITLKEGLSEWLNINEEIGFDQTHKGQTLNIAFSEEIAPGPSKLLRKKIRAATQVKIRSLMERCEKLIQETNFKPLYDHKAKLFSLGYHAERRERDEVLYDLMASEARQASYIAIALGQVSVSHWHALGRTMAKVGKRPVLLSWSGTMFEYLMPSLFLRSYRNTLWESTYKAVVNRQIDYGKQREVPFGISESGYYAFDFQMNYQYRAFGVPGLGFKRGLEEDLVVAPYATIMALPFSKQEALETLKKLEKINGRGKYGFYEAIDFTSKRLPEDAPYKVINSFMAHHQGMSLLTLSNLLLPTKMYDRFHRNKQIRSAELLLQERIPKKPKLIKHYALSRLNKPLKNHSQDASELREFLTSETKVPEVCVLSNGNFTTVVTNSGSGFSLYKGLAVTRWREDPVLDPWGSYVYIRDVSKNKVWSPSYQPCQVHSSNERVQFGLDRACFMREDDEVKTSMEICVSTEWNAEIRRITLTNKSEENKVLEVTTFVELALANPIADEAHTAFSKLFIRTSYDQGLGCLVAGRRPREENDHTLWAAHSLMVDGNTLGSIEYETDRSSFIGRGNRLSEPQEIDKRLRGRVGSVADPAFVMRRRISIDSGKQVQLVSVTSVSEKKEEAIEIINRFSLEQMVERSFQLAWNRGQIELSHLHLTNHEATIFQTLAGMILYTPPLRRERAVSILSNTKGQSSLWQFGVSGDRPIILVRVDHQSQMSFVLKMLTGHEYLRRLGILFDLVLLNESEEGYHQNLQEALQRAAESGVDRFGAGMSGTYIIPANQLEEANQTLLMAVSRIILRAGGASLRAQIRIHRFNDKEMIPEKLVPKLSNGKNTVFSIQNELENTKDWLFYNGWGGFSPDGKGYQIIIKNGCYLPAPWINVMANPNFGCLISEMGTGYTWWRNSRECKITPWSNDPVLDPLTETAYLRNEESGEVWSATPSAVPSKEPYKITHGYGFTKFEHERTEISHEMLVYVPIKDPVKIIRLKLQNKSPEERHISVTYYAEWVLGVKRTSNAPYIVTEWNESEKMMIAKNTYQETFPEATAFLGMYQGNTDQSLELSWTADRHEFIGRNGNMEHPKAMDHEKLTNRTGLFNETCGAIRSTFSIQPESEQTVYILLGCSDSNEAVLNLAHKYMDASKCELAMDEVTEFWNNHLEQIQVSTPSKEMDILLNGWLLYQSLACRMWARTAFYQAGGAYGYRDQLQDSLALLHTWPDKTRSQILLHSAHQYEEGDVQHWWHEETERGIRTMFSDDLLWLPYVVSRYIQQTGDRSILEEAVPFLHSKPLQEGELERYEPTQISEEKGTVYDHCLRAIDKALSRMGEHGLPLIGVGDWNDGMNLVGAKGRGESVWLGWFICDVLRRFMEICHMNGDVKNEDFYQKTHEQLAESLNDHAWDGQWYRRAFTDEGNWLGSIQNEECRIDAIAQSWSIISEAAPKDRAIQAMNSFDRELVERDLSIIRLLTPPFDETEHSPGYIQGYPPGIRENGAQYTHGVIWGIIALCKLQQGEKAMEMFTMLNPISHTRTNHEVRKYIGEPYVMAADVYTAEPNEGRAGWTWYTGAAGWMYQAGIEWILGLQRRENHLYIDPCIPNDWPGYSATYRFGKASYLISVINGDSSEETYLKVDGKVIPLQMGADGEKAHFELCDDGCAHHVELKLNK